MKIKQPVMLVVLDGWGIRRSKRYNAIKLAKTPNFDALWKDNPHTELLASGKAVGLPIGYQGNSEVGHEHLGAGYAFDEDLVYINKAIKNGSFNKNKVLLQTMNHVKKNKSALHIMGLLSDGGVHSHIDHLFALLKLAKKEGVERVYVHAFTDGRDTPPKSAKKYVRQLLKQMKLIGVGELVTIIGRYYSMDRDNRWKREHKAYDAIVNGFGLYFDNPIKAIDEAYKRKETDEFIKPSILYCKNCKTRHLMEDKDAAIFFNFRSDRARELTKAFVQGKFQDFKRHRVVNLHFTTFRQYDSKIKNVHVAFLPHESKDILPEVLNKHKIKQLRAAETEKYAHVTYFFNNGREHPFATESRIMIPSPHVATYDLKPEMSAIKIKNKVIETMKKKKFGFILINFANSDMVGHTGKIKSAIKAVEAVDKCLGEVVDLAVKQGFCVMITADHGNAEEMHGRFLTSHTCNKVPFILVNYESKSDVKLKAGKAIFNVAPSVLKVMGLIKPKKMSSALW